jgi:hypothetical protein
MAVTALALFLAAMQLADTHVSNGTYVQPYQATNPNSTQRANYSASGNYNRTAARLVPGRPGTDSKPLERSLSLGYRNLSTVMAYRSPKDLAESLARRRKGAKANDGYVRETFTQPREQARETARAFLDRWPAAAYNSSVEWWRELPDGQIEFGMRRLRSAD